MSTYTDNFLKSLQSILHEFRMYQLDSNEEYGFDVLGFMEWFENEKGYDTSRRSIQMTNDTDGIHKNLLNILNFKEVERETDLIYVNKSDSRIWASQFEMSQLLDAYKVIMPESHMSQLTNTTEEG